jgi:hypothetical protein
MSRRFPVLAALLVVVGAATAERPGYLSAGRLAPLRFAVDPSASRFVLPPFPTNPVPSDVRVPTNSATTSASQPTAASSAEHSESDLTPAATLAPATNEVAVTPQMLVGYYRDGVGGTNGEAGAVSPFGFMPPVAVPHQSSTAHYSSP